jgi:Oxidoreductase family, NAD-binding Rossmann fold
VEGFEAGGRPTYVPFLADGELDLWRENAKKFYLTDRNKDPNWRNETLLWSYDKMIQFSAIDTADLLTPTPLLVITGSKAETLDHGRGGQGRATRPGDGAGRLAGALCAAQSRRGKCSDRRRDEDVADSPVRWGILGTGGIASTFVTDLRLTDSGVAVAVGSRSQGSADRFADEFGISKRHASYELLVADPDVDVIYVATPHPMHRENAILALRAGKHVLVEKPFTMKAAEAREIVRVAREHGLFAMEAMWTRFLPHVAIIRDWLARSVLGDVVTVTADHGPASRRCTRAGACATRPTRSRVGWPLVMWRAR